VLSWISLADFRSYSELHWSPDPGVNVLVGDNGAGKTNLLEGVAYLGALRSFRAAPEEALVKEGAASAYVRADVKRGQSSSTVEIEIARKGRRRVRLDQKSLPRAADLLGVIRVVTFLPEDLELVKGGPGGRREMIDQLAVQLWPAAGLDQSEYDRSLRQRNAFLKAGSRDVATLEVWDSRLAQAAGSLMGRRARAAQEIAQPLSVNYSQMAGRQVDVIISYESEWGGTLDPSTPPSEWSGSLLEALQRRRRVDWDIGNTGAGPHRDDLALTIGDRPARFQSSQGEQRTLALSVRLASHAAIAGVTGRPPLLLLDDVFSELDPQRAARFTTALPEAQTLITTTRPEEVPLEGKTWRVEPGLIR